MVCHYTRSLLAKTIGHHNLVAWEEHPYRTRAHIFELLDRAIETEEGVRPRVGGWKVGGVQ